MNPWLGIGGVLALLGILLGLVGLAQKRGLPPELSRKSVHVGMGLICASFPWIFSAPWPPLLLAILAVGLLLAMRFIPALSSRFGKILGGVERKSWGEIYFPIAVALTFWLANGNWLLFVVPILILTLADAVGALIGVRYGLSRYQTDEGQKSAEGSFAFFAVAFLTSHIPLLLFASIGRAESLLIALMLGLLVMLLEAISWRGLDNLIIPLGSFLILKLYLGMSVAELVLRFLVLVGLVLFVILGRRRTTLSDSAILAAALAGYVIWALAGWLWLAPPVILFAIYVLLPGFPAGERPIQSLRAVTRAMFGAFLWLFVQELSGQREFVFPFLVCIAAHTGNIIFARLRVMRPQLGFWKQLGWAWIGAFLPFVPFVFWIHPNALFLNAIVLAVAITLSIPIFAHGWTDQVITENKFRLWFTETAVAPLASLIALLPIIKSLP